MLFADKKVGEAQEQNHVSDHSDMFSASPNVQAKVAHYFFLFFLSLFHEEDSSRMISA